MRKKTSLRDIVITLEELSPVMDEIYQAVALPEKSSALMRLKLLSAIERFKDLLESKGIELIIPAVEQDFNPEEHEAVAVWGREKMRWLNKGGKEEICR